MKLLSSLLLMKGLEKNDIYKFQYIMFLFPLVINVIYYKVAVRRLEGFQTKLTMNENGISSNLQSSF